jgi:hypothetical protein
MDLEMRVTNKISTLMIKDDLTAEEECGLVRSYAKREFKGISDPNFHIEIDQHVKTLRHWKHTCKSII